MLFQYLTWLLNLHSERPRYDDDDATISRILFVCACLHFYCVAPHTRAPPLVYLSSAQSLNRVYLKSCYRGAGVRPHDPIIRQPQARSVIEIIQRDLLTTYNCFGKCRQFVGLTIQSVFKVTSRSRRPNHPHVAVTKHHHRHHHHSHHFRHNHQHL